MRSQCSFFIFLLAFLPVKAKRGHPGHLQTANSLIGLLQVTEANVENCHLCLLKSVGVERILLVVDKTTTLTYLIKGPITTFDSLITRCNIQLLCTLQTEIKMLTSYAMPLPRNSVLENIVSQFAFEVNVALMHSPYDKTEKVKSGHVDYSRPYGRFFFDEIQFVHPKTNRRRSKESLHVEMPELLRPKYVSDKKPWIKMSGPEKEGEDKTLFPRITTCFFHPEKATFQCEECLALHSSSFRVRSYIVKTTWVRFRTIYVFSTDYSQYIIKRNCNEAICGMMESISAAACENLDAMFPNDKRMIHEAVKSAKEYGKEASPTANRMNQINSDIRGMISSESNFKLGWLISRHEVKSGAKENSMTDKKPLQKIQEIMLLEAFLSTKRWSCRFLAPSQSRRPELLKCIIDRVADKNGFFLVTSPSVTKLIILFDSNVINDYILRHCTKIYCPDSPHSGVKKHVDCDEYRNQHITNPIVYQELWMFKNVIPEKKPCLFIPQILTTFKTCGDCMKSLFYAVTGGAERTLESNSYLWWTHSEQKTWKAVHHILNNCVGKYRCRSIHLLSEMICSEHEQYSGKMKQSSGKKTDQMIPFNSLTSQLWPPTRYASGNFDSRATLMVTFEAIRTESCVTCMILRTEVFYFYAPVNDRFGYLWMTQSHTKILKRCIGKDHCINLWYQKAGKELTIRQGMQPWSSAELQLLFRMH